MAIGITENSVWDFEFCMSSKDIGKGNIIRYLRNSDKRWGLRRKKDHYEDAYYNARQKDL